LLLRYDPLMPDKCQRNFDTSTIADYTEVMIFGIDVFIKIGNGPNMSLEKIKEILRGSGSEGLEVTSTPNQLAESFGNGWSLLIVGYLLALGKLRINSAVDSAIMQGLTE